MPTAHFGLSLTIGGVAMQKNIVRAGQHPNAYEVALTPGLPAVLTTRTDDNSGILTVEEDHGITTDDTVDLFWEDGLRYGLTVTAVGATTVTVDAGTGDVLPAEDTELVVTPQVEINTEIDGDNVVIAGLLAEFASVSEASRVHLDLQDDADTTVAALTLQANTPQVYDVAGGAPNPLSGNPIARTLAANGSSATACTLKLVSLENVT